MTTHAITPADSLVAARLQQIEAGRLQQLDALPDTDLDAVATAYRDSLLRILEEIRTARRRLEAGLHGVCTGCAGDVGAERLELRPWAVSCAACARRSREPY
jgi:RNA polymerase-binding transcription factor DksA